jgi:hypothetical protein
MTGAEFFNVGLLRTARLFMSYTQCSPMHFFHFWRLFMNTRIVPLALLMASLFGCSSASNHSNHSMNLPLAATRANVGQTGNATLTAEGNQTNFDFYITGVPTGTILPPRIFTFINKGSCQQPGSVAYAMNDKVNTRNEAGANGWSFYRNAPIATSELLAGKYSVVVRTSPEDGNVDIFCGDVARAKR